MFHLSPSYLRRVFIMMMIGVSLCAASVYAQTTVTSEGQFWSLMTQTYNALSISEPDYLAELATAWEQVSAVQLTDGTILSVDMAWLVDGLTNGDAAALHVLQDRVKAVLDYRASQIPISGTGNPLEKLNQVLQDDRFQYPDVTPTPIPEQDAFNIPDIPMPGVGLSQILLIGIGLLLVAGLFVYFLRGLKIQTTAIKTADELDDVPETAADARELAQTSEQVQDYRNAVRYLYLSSLLTLDEQGLIHFDRTLTNREHLQQIANQPRLLEMLRPVVNTFDNVWYGFAVLDEVRYEEFRRNVDRLRELAQ